MGGFGPEMVSPAQGRRPSHLGVEESMISKQKTKKRKLAEFLFRSTCVPTGHDRREPRPDAMVNVLRVNYIGIVMQIQLPGIE